jgi:long-chain acyl-CoA synthetase
MEKIWLKSYPTNVPADVLPLKENSLAELMEGACKRYGDKAAYISMDKTMSFAELDRVAMEFAGWLQSVGLGKGSRVALMMPNLFQYPVCLFGALRAGCVVVNVNPLYTPRELEHQMKDSGAEAIVVVENFAGTVEKVLAHTQLRHIVVTPMGELLGGVKGTLVNLVVKHVKKLVPKWHIPGAVNLRHALAAGRRHGFQAPQINLHDLAFLQYTGGTTGVAKGAMLSHRNIVANVTQASAWIAPPIREHEELIVTALPLYHIFALTVSLTLLRLGARNLLIANPRDIPGFVKDLQKHPFTVITGVNTLFNALLNNPGFAKLDFSNLVISLGGGMAVQKPVADRWKAVTGKPLLQAYGLTETSPAATINPLYATDFNGSIGLPISSTEIAVRGDNGIDLGVGEIGEICIRGPQVTKGYWQRDDETAAVFHADGFLRTGDIGYMDEKGFVFLVDRKKDMILVSGFNVYPNEVEEVVAALPGVREVAAIGIPDPRCGEAVKIFVVRKDPDLTAEAIIAYCRTQLTSYKVPHHVEFRDDLPKTNVGKVLRRALKEP